MKGKIVKINSRFGFITNEDGVNAFYLHKNYTQFKIGDNVNFEIKEEKVKGADQTFNRAINLKLIDAPKPNLIRLNKILRELDISLNTAVDFFSEKGIIIEKRPTTKISMANAEKIVEHFIKKRLSNNSKSNEDHFIIELGKEIEVNIINIVYPSLIIVDFFNNQKAILPLQNLSWNIFQSQKIFSTLKVGSRLKVVVLENELGKNVIVSKKHLYNRPSEKNNWNKYKVGEKLNGTIEEILVNKLVVSINSHLYGIINISNDQKSLYKIGDSLNLILNGRDELNQFLKLGIQEDVDLDDEVETVQEDYQTQDEDLKSSQAFKKSIYYTVANKEDRESVLRWFEEDNKLFSSAITLETMLFLNFGINTKAWDNDFKNALLPYLGTNKTEKDGLEFLSNQKYWVRTNTRVDNNEGEIIHDWVLFNEKIYVSGRVFVEEQDYNFVIFSLSLERTKKWHSLDKTNNLNAGTFLLNSKVRFLSATSSRPLESNQKNNFLKIQSKVMAFQTLNKLKKESGAILRDEGLSISIFDKFLEYQEDNERKGNEKSRIPVNSYEVIPNTITETAIEIKLDLDDLFGGNGDENQMVAIRTEELSHKENKDKEFVIFCDAIVEATNEKTKLHLKNLNKPLDILDDGFFIEPKVSLRQYQVQREVIKDFFDKKLKLDHIESLLVRPEKIKPPEETNLTYINKLLEETEKKQPNNNQVRAVKKAVGNNNVFLIQGPPGTGKTTVIAEVVEQLITKGEKILVASQTHIAVDNVLEKVARNKSLTCVRLGNAQRIKEDLRQYQIDNLIEAYSEDFEKLITTNINQLDYVLSNEKDVDFSTLRPALKGIIIENSADYRENFKEVLINKNYEFLEMLSKTSFSNVNKLKDLLIEWKNNLSHEKEILIKPLLYKSIDVAFATCIGVRTDRELNEYNLKFDTVIIDEAGKANISETLAAISMAKKVILVGDQMQLPPYIDGSLLDENEATSFPKSKYGKNFLKEDIQHALKTSFFEFLVKRIANKQFPEENKELLNYQHRMHPHIGEFISDSFYEGKVKMGEHTYKNRLQLSSPFEKEVVFINTSSAQNPYESSDDYSTKNNSEAYCISKLVIPKLIESGLAPNDFAVVAPYKSQVKHIKKSLQGHNNSHLIEVSTLDSFQGMEFDVIVFSFTRAASPDQRNKKVGFLDDARRLNVAFSRAKKKLILVGNSETLTDPRSHYDTLFNYTGLFSRLVDLSKNDSIGNFVNLTDFKDLKSNFQLLESKLKVGVPYNCKLKLSFDKFNYTGHIFYINEGLEGMFRDDNKSFVFDKETEYPMYISAIDRQKEHIYLSPNKPLFSKKNNSDDSKRDGQYELKLKKLQFFKSISLGDIIDVKYKTKIDIGHFFEIEKGFDGFLYDPKMNYKKFIKGRNYKMMISKIQVSKGRVNLSIPNRKNGII
ncbi:AAA domain-containing protein [Winogradskyella sp. SYSU M77433]|uniref:AAA domain-containing protein n=1 Tax=Winogradskyella sp. SYSU M77433 TaxID=3042722 RepID=UPI0024810158|nr:AAA domain-containing protein [Winogradskyella sp. SYSU M77433]MDH7912793.1 AAA domain-containing protein [Winogradskyella sp. SYSU M77433]